MFGRKKNDSLTVEAVMAALSTVIEPELHRDLVSLNMVKDVIVDGNDVTFTIVLTTPACPLKGKMEADSRAALTPIGVQGMKIVWDAKVPTDSRIADQIGQNFATTIAVSSGKGGVGKSTISTNLAIALAKTGARVGLLDADILGPNIPMMTGIEGERPPVKDRKMIPIEKFGIKIMSMALLVKPDQAMVWRGPMLHSAIRQLLSDVEWGDLDYLVVDLPPGTGDAQLSLAQTLPLSGAVIVTQPMEVAAADALRGFKIFEKLNVPIIGVIENMSGEFFGSGAGEKLAVDHDLEYLGSIPLDSVVRKGGDVGEPAVVSYPDSPSAQALTEISQKGAARVSVLTLQNQNNFIPIEMIG